ncbi:MAG: electron transport complex subunit RsxC [Pseudomonadota bacterium]
MTAMHYTTNPGRTRDIRLHRFHGGLKLPSHSAISMSLPVANAGIPAELVIPLQQHIGETAIPLVRPGERVLKGQMIAAPRGTVSAPVHASSSGTVTAIEARAFPHPSGMTASSIVIATDGKDEWQTADSHFTDYRQTTPAELLEHIRNAGIVGLGGAGFPTGVKLGTAANRAIDLLLINGVECEPYITCDNMLMQERAREILAGTHILQHILNPQHCIIAIEDGMPAAGAALRTALNEAGEENIEVVSVPEIYPSGGERQLIKVLTGHEVPGQGFPSDIGIVCQNVGTAAAVYQAVVHNHPLVSRLVTVTGEGVRQPRNLDTLIGTPFSYLVAACGGYTADVDRLLMGGPMMGFAVHTDDTPVIKTTNCILAVTREEMPAPPPALPCIRCSKCTEVCPADLLPQQLYLHAHSGNLDAAQDYNLFDCIECGCCAHVCPSHIPLVQYYRHAKTEIWSQEKQKKAADIARRRHEARLARLERIKRERAERMARKKQAVAGKDEKRKDAKQAAIQAALERVRQKKTQTGVTPKNTDNLTPEQQEEIREVDRRRQH